jgi:hypothetical protein
MTHHEAIRDGIERRLPPMTEDEWAAFSETLLEKLREQPEPTEEETTP